MAQIDDLDYKAGAVINLVLSISDVIAIEAIIKAVAQKAMVRTAVVAVEEEAGNGAVKGGSMFFENASYSSKVLKQMGKTDDLFHGFPKSIDGFAEKFGQYSTQIGGDGKVYQWLKMEGSYGGKTELLITDF